MNEMIVSGVELMIIGMGIVFLFLAMLIVAVNVMSLTIQRYFPQISEVTASPTHHATDESVIAAITAAVHQYRSKHK